MNELFNEATVFVQTSRHEGFCLPPLEAMAAGTPVVCTDAHGNRDFCRDGENCLMAARRPRSRGRGPGAGAGRRRSCVTDSWRAACATVGEYAWERRIDEVEAFFNRLAEPAYSSSASRGA